MNSETTNGQSLLTRNEKKADDVIIVKAYSIQMTKLSYTFCTFFFYQFLSQFIVSSNLLSSEPDTEFTLRFHISAATLFISTIEFFDFPNIFRCLCYSCNFITQTHTQTPNHLKLCSSVNGGICKGHKYGILISKIIMNSCHAHFSYLMLYTVPATMFHTFY